MSDKLQKHRRLSKILPVSSEKRLVVLTGARQTGKTTLVRQFYPDVKYINFDAPENREAIRGISSVNWAKDVGNALLDEAQKEPVVFEKVKYAYDAGQISFTVILGSAQILLLGKVRESLAGRVFLFELWPLMLSEILDYGDTSILLERVLDGRSLTETLNAQPAISLPEAAAPALNAENYLLKWGGMPALLGLKDDDRKSWLRSYEYTYLERDLGDLAKLKDLDPFRKFQRLTALRSAGLLNYSELSKDAGISVDTARRYLEYLKLSYQTILLQPYYENLTSSVIKSPKVYFTDVGILRQTAGFAGEISGEIYETYVVAEIYKWINSCQKAVEVYFYRTRSGLELDLLLKTEKGFLGIEIKSSPRIARVDYSPMLAVAEKLGDRWLGGLCIYRGKELKKVAEPDIWAVPSFRLFS